MAENENMVVDQMPPEEQPQESKAKAVLQKIGAGLKEWGRKQIVALKRRPHFIPLFITLITSVIYLLCLRTYSKVVMANFAVEWAGFCVFVNTLLSVLVLALYTSAFPKRTKPNIVLVGLIFVFYIVMLLLDVLYYVRMNDYLLQSTMTDIGRESLNNAILHMVFGGISIIVLALLPVYSKLIMKIDTSKEIESNNINEVIETEDDEQ